MKNSMICDEEGKYLVSSNPPFSWQSSCSPQWYPWNRQSWGPCATCLCPR